MKNNRRFLFATAAVVFAALQVTARENVPNPNGGHRIENPNQVAAQCNAGTAQTELSVNNVRTTILTGGDMWWDLSTARYEIPKGGGAHSVFAGSLWIGGVDAGGQLKVAAMTYRQTGNDYWPGPLDTVNVSTDQTVCDQYDKHFRIKRQDVDDFYANTISPQTGYQIPSSILNWPGNGDPGRNQAHYLAPFYDANGDGFYDPSAGDFPDFYEGAPGQSACTAGLYGDEALWWVFNDKGNIHTESGANAIGIEIQAQAFGFNTNDEINNMTFYAYKVFNRSFFTVNNCYFGQWVDADLGLYSDDYVGCDVSRGLGYTYNGDADDGGGAPGTYGLNPPCIGCDFFQGPLADSADGVDNNRNCVIDEPNEQIIMSKFVYYNNDFTVLGNPVGGQDIYNYLRGIWLDNTPITYGGNGHNTGQPCSFMFPDASDQQFGWGLGGTCNPNNPVASVPWNETNAPNQVGDRRFLQTAGPFTLKPGAVNNVKVGLVWARATSGGNLASIGLVKVADDKAQKLFENCFQVLNGPDAPDLTIQELDKQLLVYLSNKSTSNNYLENYSEYDPLIIDTVSPNRFDTTFNFEGYQVFQLANAQVGQGELLNPDKARLVFQSDVKNGVSQLINFNYDQSLNANIPELEVTGEDKGITHSFTVTDDKFATGDINLVNHKTYYYMAIAYGYNQYVEYKPDVTPDPSNIYAPSYNGQKKPYKPGRKNVKVYSAIPHIPSPEANGTVQNSYYGMGPKIQRIEGHGNGGMVLDLTQSSIDAILSSSANINYTPTYENSHGPVNVKVIDPLNVPSADFELKFTGVATTSNWTLKNITSGVTKTSEKTLALEAANEQVIPEWGLSVSITTTYDPGNLSDDTKGFLEGTMTFANDQKQWLTGLPDQDGYTYQNWIRSGVSTDQTGNACLAGFDDYAGVDNEGVYEKVIGGTWAPYRLVAAEPPLTTNPCYVGGPGWKKNYMSLSAMKNLASIDVVITADKSKWSRCVVFEECNDSALAEKQGNAFVRKMDIRGGASVDKDGNANFPSTDNNDFATGMGWFPGYAINLETGERLNIAFGENSWMQSQRGRDMIWNPTSNSYASNGDILFGGEHYIYVFGHNFDDVNHTGRYDGCNFIRTKMTKTSTTTPVDNDKRNVFQDAMWVNIPLLRAGYDFNKPSSIPCDAKIRLRVKRNYGRNYSSQNSPDSANPSQNLNKPYYKFNTSDLRVETSNLDAAKNALDLINVVPNPYYAYSEYEKNQLDNRIKITNLPEKCTVKIYTLNGVLVRTFKKDDPKTSVDWDLKNTKGIPIASGMYIIYVNVDGVGEKVLKWFGVIRPLDLDQF